MTTPLDEIYEVLGEAIGNQNRIRMSIPVDLKRDHDVRITRGVIWARDRIARLEAEKAEVVAVLRDVPMWLQGRCVAGDPKWDAEALAFGERVDAILAKHKEQA